VPETIGRVTTLTSTSFLDIYQATLAAYQAATTLSDPHHNIISLLEAPALEPEVAAAIEENAAVADPKPVSFGLFQWVVSGLLTVLVAVVAFGVSSVTGDITELKTSSITLTKAINDTRVDMVGQMGSLKTELVQAIGGVKEQAAITNGKIDVTNQRLNDLINAQDQTVPKRR
jgi:hypothetical protein